MPAKKKKTTEPTKEKESKQKPIKKDTGPKPARRKFFLVGKIIIAVIVIILIGAAVFGYIVVASTEGKIVDKDDKSSLLRQLGYLVTSPDKPLVGQEQDRINFLLLGMGGPGHAGGQYLTDTIIVASFKPSTEQVAMISVPRDLVVFLSDSYGYRKINNTYAFGETDDEFESGIDLSVDVIEEVMGLEIHYWTTIDFEGFRQVVDTLEGVETCVENAFVDYQFPDYNFGYQTISFAEGCQTMMGEEALQYARSRKGTGGEGSDFARSKRQQQIIMATKEKFFSVSTLMSPSKISEIIDSVGNHIKTNMEVWEMVNLAKLASDINEDEIINKVLDNDSGGILHAEIIPETGAYVLIPDAGLGNYKDIHALANIIFEYGEILAEGAIIEIRNGTTIAGQAQKTKNFLAAMDYEIDRIGNATITDNQTTIIYDLTNGQKPKTLANLKDILDAQVAYTVPDYLLESNSNVNANENINLNTNTSLEDIDFLIILGFDQETNTNINTQDLYID